MIRKPWPIILISLIFFLMPFLNIVFTSFVIKSQFSFYDYIYSLTNNPANHWPLFDMVVPSFLAGIAVYCVKKWSYPVFLVCMAWITIQTFRTFSLHLQFSEIALTLFLPMFFNILYVSYILLPNVRAAYYDPRLRWWETKPRYIFSTQIQISANDDIFTGNMTNISEGGIFALITTPVDPNSIIGLKFNILSHEINLKAKVVYRKSDSISHGLQFVEVSKEQKKILKNIIASLIKDKYEEVRPVPVWTEDLAKWFHTLIKTGKGLVPEIPQNNRIAKKD